MNRLTVKTGNNIYVKSDLTSDETTKSMTAVIAKLSDYEDTGFDPNQIISLVRDRDLWRSLYVKNSTITQEEPECLE